MQFENDRIFACDRYNIEPLHDRITHVQRYEYEKHGILD